MNKIVNKFLLVGNKFMPKLHLRQPGFTYSTCAPFTKHCERIKKFKATSNLNDIYKKELDTACFALDAAYSDSKKLWVRPLKDKKAKTISNGFIGIVNEYNLWIDEEREFYKNLMQKRLDDNSTHNEGMSVVDERFIRTLEGKIYKKMTGNIANLILVI